MTSRECNILQHILNYCTGIKETVARFGDSFDTFCEDRDYRNSVAMGVMQIGELSTHLSEEFKTSYPDIPWKDIRGMRNVVAHHYGKIDETILFEIVQRDISPLAEKVGQILADNFLLQEHSEPHSSEPEMKM